MPDQKKQNIYTQMFDVRPVNKAGQVDIERISSLEKVIKLQKKQIQQEKLSKKTTIITSQENNRRKKAKETYEFGTSLDKRFEEWMKKVKHFEDEKRQQKLEAERERKKAFEAHLLMQEYEKELARRKQEAAALAKRQELEKDKMMKRNYEKFAKNQLIQVPKTEKHQQRKENNITNSTRNFFTHLLANYQDLDKLKLSWKMAFAKPALSFVAAGFAIVLIAGATIYISYGLQLGKEVQVLGEQAIGDLQEAKQNLAGKDLEAVDQNIQNAAANFSQAQSDIEMLGGNLLDIVSELPYLSKLSSGKNVVFAGNELAQAAQELSKALPVITKIQNPLQQGATGDVSLIEVFQALQTHINNSRPNFEKAGEYIEKVNIEDLPEDYREKFQAIKMALPVALSTIDAINEHSMIFLELLGNNGPRKYLLLFQNNNEMRATGGFIGSYGLINIMDGHVKKVLIEGIFNPDGQFKEDIIPPKPLQKITAGWSTHDANWFPHFPSSAQKIGEFYEKTGGPTIDGIITLTPAVLEKMLEVSGPIEMEDYGTVVDSENFIRQTQFEVEIDYDREENKPKQFLADLAPIILESLFNQPDPAKASKTIKTLTDALKEKHILMYSYEPQVQEVISNLGWSGEIRQTQNDFLMVINSNINGYKTDGIIDETITHQAKIMEDGSVMDTVRIKRVHNGGDSDYEWWNKVNSDYMRVYVPKGSKLVSATGQTREVVEPPLDYEKLGFKTDDDVRAEEENMVIDEETGTRIYDEQGKTVFANWVYVSPKETVELEYVYILPFKIALTKENHDIDTYSLLTQKQPGSKGSEFHSEVKLDGSQEAVWKYPEELQVNEGSASLDSRLDQDRFLGVVLQKKK